MEIYPLTITMDRYEGTYSKGKYVAWRLDHWEVPEDPVLYDVTCMKVWDTYKGLVGEGESPESAVKDLESKYRQVAMALHKKYDGPISLWIEAVKLCEDEKSAYEYVIRRSGGMKG